ncbi:MAG: hypothetical protein JST89_08340 [Cyanobacteria bacterium SZAS-4]|nr:hypothetical protein [Cyanobacteria bacterium SZAS-4]
MSTTLDRSCDRGASSPADANSDHNLSHEIWNEVLNRSRASANDSRDQTSGTSCDTESDHENDHVITFSDIFTEIKDGYNKIISILTGRGDDKPQATTGIEKGSTQPLDCLGQMDVTLDVHGKPSVLQYGDGSTRHFGYKDKELIRFTDRTGKQYMRDPSGDWTGPDGKPAHISNVNVTPDGTFSYKETQTDNVIVCQLDGSYKTVTPDQFGDLKLYPDSNDHSVENERLENLAGKNGFLNPDGQKLLSELNKLGIDDVDALYGSHIVFGGDGTNSGDGGALYRQLINEYPVKERGSSHYPGTKTEQYQIITGPDNSAVLFGLTPDGNTFIQFEKDAAGSADHMKDYNLYRTLDQNIGPLGTSPYTDKNPLEIGYMLCQSLICGGEHIQSPWTR